MLRLCCQRRRWPFPLLVLLLPPRDDLVRCTRQILQSVIAFDDVVVVVVVFPIVTAATSGLVTSKELLDLDRLDASRLVVVFGRDEPIQCRVGIGRGG